MTPPQPVRVGSGATTPRGRGPSAVFLDRDGVLNETGGDGSNAASPRSVAELRVVDGVERAVERLHAEGHLLIVVTNPPDVARGKITLETAVEMTRVVVDILGLDDGFVCVHDGTDGCRCRKPLPGLLEAAAVFWDIDLRRSWLIGDRWVDIAAAHAAGVRGVLLERAYSTAPAGGVAPPSDLRAPDAVCDSLLDAVAVVTDQRDA